MEFNKLRETPDTSLADLNIIHKLKFYRNVYQIFHNSAHYSLCLALQVLTTTTVVFCHTKSVNVWTS